MDQVSRDLSPDTAALITIANGFLDAFTFVGHGGVFANAQSGNVILFGIGLAEPRLASSFAHLWPVLAFIAGIALARALRNRVRSSPRLEPRTIVLGVQALVLAVIALLPANAPQWTITTSIGMTSALQMSSFRTVRSSAFVPIAMTGNLMRVTEAFGDVWTGTTESRTVTFLYVTLIATFTGGAVLGALLTTNLHTTAALIPAGLFVLASTLLIARARSGAVRQRGEPADRPAGLAGPSEIQDETSSGAG